MSISTCFTYTKNITKKGPGIACSRCEKRIHINNLCVKLSNKQLETLRNNPGLEWSCDDCLCNASHRSSILIQIKEFNEEDDETVSSNKAGTNIYAT